MLKQILGLDLGSYAVKVAQFQQTWNGLVLTQLCEMPRREEESLATTLRALFDAYKIESDTILCAIPATQMTSRHLSFPFHDRKKLKQAVPFELAEYVPFDLEDFVIDWELVQSHATESQVLATLTRRSGIAALLAELQEAGIDPSVIEAEGLVLGNLANFFALSDTRLLIDLGHSKTILCLLLNGQPIATRTIPVAGLAITQEIAREGNLDLASAERLKHAGIFHDGFRSASPGALQILDRIVREIARTLEASEKLLGGSASERIAGISIFGGSAQLPRLDEYLSERTGFPAQRLQLPTPTPTSNIAPIALSDPTPFGGALALGLRGAAKPRTKTNFRQDEFAYRFDFAGFSRNFASTAILAGVTLFLCCALVITMFGLRSSRAHSIEAMLQANYQELFPNTPPPTDPLRALRAELDRAHEEADFLGLYRGDRSALDLLTEIATRMPPDHAVLLREVRINRNVINLRGQAVSFEAVDQFKAHLRECEAFTQTEVNEVNSDAEGKVFSMTIGLASDAKTSDAPTKSASAKPIDAAQTNAKGEK